MSTTIINNTILCFVNTCNKNVGEINPLNLKKSHLVFNSFMINRGQFKIDWKSVYHTTDPNE